MPVRTSRTGATHPQYDTASNGHLRWAAPPLRPAPCASTPHTRPRPPGPTWPSPRFPDERRERPPEDVAARAAALAAQPARHRRPRAARHLAARLAPAHRELADPALAGADRLGLGLLHRHLARRLPARLQLGRLLPALPAADLDRPRRAGGRRRDRRAQRVRADAARRDGRPLHAGQGAALRGDRVAGRRLPDALSVRVRVLTRLHRGAVPRAGRLDLRVRRSRPAGVRRRAGAARRAQPRDRPGAGAAARLHRLPAAERALGNRCRHAGGRLRDVRRAAAPRRGRRARR